MRLDAPAAAVCYAARMEPLDTVYRWSERMRDRARMQSFARFLAERFLADKLFQAAAALSYTTVFALVPLAIVVFGVHSLVIGPLTGRLQQAYAALAE